MCTMDAFSSIACYSVLLLCFNLAHSINADSKNQNLLHNRQHLNGTLSISERSRRLIPYVTYYVVGNNDESDDQYQHQQNFNFNPNTPRPTADNLYFQNEKKPQHIVQQPNQHQHNYQNSNQVFQQHTTPGQHHIVQQPNQHQHNYQTSNQVFQQHTTPGYLRFPSSSKFRRPIVIGTSETPYTAQAEKTNDYYYDYTQTSPRPIIKPNPNKYNHGFLPTIPPTPYTHLELSSTKPKKLKRPQPKRPFIPITTTTDKYGALNELLNGYDLGNKLSNKITAENIDSSINTLSAVLDILQKEADVQVRPKKFKPIYRPDPIDEYDTGDEGNQGRAGIDYPTLSVIPKTSFDCRTQRYKGFFGDPETKCQVWHYCDLNGGQASFLCPNGTIFNQVTLTCDWWFNVKCDTTTQLYVLNERLYKYIIPPKPSFPEDYEGPLVDKYLEDKFRETENKRSQQREQTMASILNTTTIEPDSVGTPYQQLLDVDT